MNTATYKDILAEGRAGDIIHEMASFYTNKDGLMFYMENKYGECDCFKLTVKDINSVIAFYESLKEIAGES